MTRAMMTKFVLKTDFSERISLLTKEIWDELVKKQDITVFAKKFEQYEQDSDKHQTRFNKDIQTLRELFQRMRDKAEETMHTLIEIKGDVDKKMSSKEGQKLWANFKKYAQYDELKDLY